MNEVIETLPTLRKNLNQIRTEYAYETKYIGQAIAYLVLLEDLLKKELETKDNL
jgi:hypothetical protein